jgi:hypothetical protein
METLKSYSTFTLNETIRYQGAMYIIKGIKELTRGLKSYTIERL